MEDKLYRFASYYKYRFTYVSDDGESLTGGGDSSDIYRAGLEEKMTRTQLENELGELESYNGMVGTQAQNPPK